MVEQPLPSPFRDLEPYLDWAVEGERQRTEKKVASSMDEVRAFYDAVFPRLDDIVSYLDGVPENDMPEPGRRLYNLSLSLVEVANLVEIYKRREVIEACDPLHFNPQL